MVFHGDGGWEIILAGVEGRDIVTNLVVGKFLKGWSRGRFRLGVMGIGQGCPRRVMVMRIWL